MAQNSNPSKSGSKSAVEAPQPEGNGDGVEGFEAVAPRGLKQRLHLFCGQRPHLFPTNLRSLDGLVDVARDKAISDGLLERLVKSDVNVLDAARRESGIKLLTIESARVRRGQVLELHLTQHRAYVEADHLLIPLKGCGAYRVTHGIGKPWP